MEQYATEEQQVEAIKKFWKDNGIAIVVGAVIGLGGLWGWRYYSDSQLAAKEEASAAYQKVVEAQADMQSTDQLKTFIENNTDTGYAIIAGLVAAQKAVDLDNFSEAEKHLQQVANEAEDKQLAAVASTRLARVQLELGKTEDALASLEKVTLASFASQVDEIKGDIFARQGDVKKAREAYTRALAASENSPLIKVKLDNLAAVDQAE
ncbi:tetratricopeptide repeat protein [Alteromonas ponticola]|uniref:Ancillary SecYEG translocon subunit n=1 Tax=Alteromonas aquimaris TaxID=2998417 RepID=A0ABT3P497_9ALTE|nr:tetratricopeptide repeat protein [Alteromonas aquimaris]MCW8107325.1 tetratricopeptide repeat protein [Alteromonas aquimaris]